MEDQDPGGPGPWWTRTHGVPLAVPPGPPQGSVAAVGQPVGAGELLPTAAGVAALSAHHRQEGQLTQVHLGGRRTVRGLGY